jgi:hypothetical protein
MASYHGARLYGGIEEVIDNMGYNLDQVHAEVVRRDQATCTPLTPQIIYPEGVAVLLHYYWLCA